MRSRRPGPSRSGRSSTPSTGSSRPATRAPSRRSSSATASARSTASASPPTSRMRTRYLVYVGQGGLGLPDRDYYLKDDERSHAARRGVPRPRRDPAGQPRHRAGRGARGRGRDHRVRAPARRGVAHPGAAARPAAHAATGTRWTSSTALMPRWRLAALVREVGGTQPTVSVDCPDFFRVLDEAIADTPVDVLRHYLRWRVVKTYASSLPPAFEDASFAFYGTLLGGQQAPKPRWKRVLDLATQDIGELVSQLYVAEALPARREGPLRAPRRAPAGGDGHGDPHQPVDDRGHPRGGARASSPGSRSRSATPTSGATTRR